MDPCNWLDLLRAVADGDRFDDKEFDTDSEMLFST
jgi:hypothetical protein